MSFAEARMKRLRALSLSFASGLRKIAGVALAGFAGVFAGFGASKIFGGLFEGAVEQAVEAEQRVRAISFSLLKLNQVRKQGLPFAQKQAELILKQNELLARQGVLHDDVFNEMSKTLALYGVPPKQIMNSVSALGDMLVATRGVTASEEEAARLAGAVAKAIFRGQGRALLQYGVVIDKTWAKEHATYQSRLDSIMAMIKAYKGANKAAENTPIGRIQKLRNELQKTREEIGFEMLPLQAELADQWRKALPQVKPAIIFVFRGLLSIMKRVSSFITQSVVPALNNLSKWWNTQGAQQKEHWKTLGILIGVATAALAGLSLVAGGPFALIAVAVGGAIFGIIQLNSHLDELRARQDAIGSVARGLQKFDNWLMPFVERFKTNFVQGWIDLYENLGKVDNFLKPFGENLKGLGKIILDFLLSPIRDTRKAWNDLLDAWGRRPTWLGGGAATASAAAAKAAAPPAAAQAAARTPRSPVPNDVQMPPPVDAYRGGGRGSQGLRQSDIDAAAAVLNNAPAFGRGGVVSQPQIVKIAERGPEMVLPLRDLLGRATGMSSSSDQRTSVSFAPNITINGNATEDEQRRMSSTLRDLSHEFIKNFTAAQRQSRRLSYEGGYA